MRLSEKIIVIRIRNEFLSLSILNISALKIKQTKYSLLSDLLRIRNINRGRVYSSTRDDNDVSRSILERLRKRSSYITRHTLKAARRTFALSSAFLPCRAQLSTELCLSLSLWTAARRAWPGDARRPFVSATSRTRNTPSHPTSIDHVFLARACTIRTTHCGENKEQSRRLAVRNAADFFSSFSRVSRDHTEKKKDTRHPERECVERYVNEPEW